MEALFRLVLITSLYASVVGIVIIAIKAILKNKINPQWHYIIWIVLIIKLLIPFGPKSAISLFNTVPQIPQQTNFTQMYDEYHQAITFIRQEKPHIPTSWTIQDRLLHIAAKAEAVMPYIWFAGAVLMLGWLIFTNYSLNRKIKKSVLPIPESINLILEDCKKKMGVEKDIRIVIQNIISTPALLGVFNPKILISPAISNLSDKEISYILRHELAHYKRKDLIVNHLLLLLQLVHWFNPVIWYCFKLIRQDMEVAADERVLTLLEAGEQKEYGKALLSVIENFNFPRIAPRLIGMVDDKKNIEKRIKMIKMMGFFKNRRRTVLIIGVICFVVLSGILLTSGLTKSDSASDEKISTVQSNEYNAAELMKFKTAYVGDNSKVVNLLSSLPFASMRRDVSLKTDSKPYGISVKYDLGVSSLSTEVIEAQFRRNATVVFALIDNVDEISFNCEERKYQYTRDQLQLNYVKDLREYAKDVSAVETLLNNFSLYLIAHPEKYRLTSSSTPGISILAQYGGVADKIEYSTTSGGLLTWDRISGKISKHGQSVELPTTTPVYWSPSIDGTGKDASEITVKAVVFNKNDKLAQKQVNIKFDNSTNSYTVIPSSDVIIADTAKPQSQNPKNIEEAVSLAIKAQGKGYSNGEAATEGHIILETEEKDEIVKVYTISSFAWFGFENGIFTGVSGSGAIPTVIIFSKNQSGEYLLIEYKEPMDGAGYLESIKKMFPKKLWDKVRNTNKYPELARQQEEQARHYLESIGRNAKVSTVHVEKKLANINVAASNKLFSEFTKKDPELNRFPYWVGTKELLENGVRYVYETSQSKTSDGFDLISFKKTKEDGTWVRQYLYKIVGDEPQLLERRTISPTVISDGDEENALKVVKDYFNAFAKTDYNTMCSLSTEYHNKEMVHTGDVWGMKWARAKEIKYAGERNGRLRFEVSVDMETVKTSAQYPSTQTIFYIELTKDKNGIWQIDRYATV